MLQSVNEICVKHDIVFYLAYGTLLGAVRHSKSIPWDYDIDIMMERKEFERFRTYVHELPKELKLWDVCYSSIEYAGLSRVIKPGDSALGDVHIDIFVLDFARNVSPIQWRLRGALCRFLNIAKLSKSEKDIIYEHFKDNKGKKFIVFLGEILGRIFGGARIEKWVYRLAVSAEPTEWLLTLESPAEPMRRELFSDVKQLEYEDSMFSVPAGYELLLKQWYGDYWEIPKAGKQWLLEEQIEEC